MEEEKTFHKTHFNCFFFSANAQQQTTATAATVAAAPAGTQQQQPQMPSTIEEESTSVPTGNGDIVQHAPPLQVLIFILFGRPGQWIENEKYANYEKESLNENLR